MVQIIQLLTYYKQLEGLEFQDSMHPSDMLNCHVTMDCESGHSRLAHRPTNNWQQYIQAGIALHTLVALTKFKDMLWSE